MANVLKHRFTSVKTDGADPTQVQPSHWNDGHGFTGGAAGDVLTRDLTDAIYGAKWAAPAVTIAYDSTVGNPIPVYAPAGLGTAPTVIYWDGIANTVIHGIKTGIDGQVITIKNRNPTTILSFAHYGTAGAGASRLLNVAQSGPTPIADEGWITYVYLAAHALWFQLGHEQGNRITVPFNAANYTGQGAITAAMVKLHEYTLTGRAVLVTLALEGIPISGAGAQLHVNGIPFTFPAPYPSLPCVTTINGPWGTSMGSPNPNGGVTFSRFDFATWTGGPHYVYWQGTIRVT